MKSFLEEVDIKIPLILYNGAKIYDPISQKFVYEKYLSEEDYHQIIEAYFIEDIMKKIDLLIFDDEGIFCYKLTRRIERQMKKDSTGAVEINCIKSICKKRPIKCMLLGEEEALKSFGEKLVNCNIINSEIGLLEIIPNNVNKGIALKELIRILEVDESQCVVVGDNLNDLEMISQSLNGIAVKNAHPKIKEIANWITNRTNDEDAIIEIIENIMKGSEKNAI